MQLKKNMEKLHNGDYLKIIASDMGFYEDVKTWAKVTGNSLINLELNDGKVIATVRKQAQDSSSDGRTKSNLDGQTIVAFSNDFDRLMATMIIANGGLALGNKVTLFFTFWGLSALRKENFTAGKKPFMDRMFSKMLPKGTKKTKLSKMNMLNFGPKMMRHTMKQKNVETLENLLSEFLANGGKIIACTMSMDVMGISADELIDGIEYGGVATYIGEAQESFQNLFI